MSARILVVDDDTAVRFTLRGLCEDDGHTVEEAPDGAAALERLQGERFALVLSDLRMPGLDGLTLLSRIAALERPPRVVLLTAHGSERTAVEAMKRGAFDYLSKPFEVEELRAVVRRALGVNRLEEENERLRGELGLARHLVFASEAMAKLAERVQRVAPRDVTVLIQGESGTGKERVAEALVALSHRRDRPFVRFNCAALPGELAEAELFGHSRGAFTGAVRARPGLFREADGGTLFLDEVAELSPGTQAKLLRALQEGEVRAVGEERPVRVDVRILAATHRDLATEVAAGRFREDLRYRLEVVKLAVPPLRERPDDLEVLVPHLLARAAHRFGLPVPQATPALLTRLRSHAWPGNVRELENALESALALSAEGEFDLSLLPGGTTPTSSSPGAGLKERVEAYERGLVMAALAQAHGNQSEAARLLGIGRATLHDKLTRWGK